MQAGSGGDLAVLELEPAPGLLVARHDLRHQIALFQPRPEGGMAERLQLEQLRQAEQDERELDGGEGHGVLRKRGYLGLAILTRAGLGWPGPDALFMVRSISRAPATVKGASRSTSVSSTCCGRQSQAEAAQHRAVLVEDGRGDADAGRRRSRRG